MEEMDGGGDVSCAYMQLQCVQMTKWTYTSRTGSSTLLCCLVVVCVCADLSSCRVFPRIHGHDHDQSYLGKKVTPVPNKVTSRSNSMPAHLTRPTHHAILCNEQWKHSPDISGHLPEHLDVDQALEGNPAAGVALQPRQGGEGVVDGQIFESEGTTGCRSACRGSSCSW